MIIVPSILSDSLETIQKQVDALVSVGIQRVQIDIIDPDFADTITIAPIDLLEIDLKGVSVDFHLMTNDPINDVLECSQIPGVKTIIAQVERMSNQQEFIEHVRSYSIGPAFSLDLYTQVDEIHHGFFSDLSLVQVMGNKAGKQGQQFLSEIAIAKIHQLDQIRKKDRLGFQIAVDIGMNPENARVCFQAGADMVAPGSYLWNAPNLQQAIEAYS